jgi:hypothetical protein
VTTDSIRPEDQEAPTLPNLLPFQEQCQIVHDMAKDVQAQLFRAAVVQEMNALTDDDLLPGQTFTCAQHRELLQATLARIEAVYTHHVTAIRGALPDGA